MMSNPFPLGRKLCEVLAKGGKECYVVGGAVRDHLMGTKPGDIDLTTNALPSETDAIFKKEGCTVIPVGERFGTMKVRCKHEDEFVEVTTYRSEGGYADRRHPDSVKFETKLEEDLKRRDFTVNAIAYDPVKDEVVDPLGGKKDIDTKIIRAVGNPDERFNEDPLRMIRMCRFKGKLGFDIDPVTEEAVSRNKNLLQEVPGERVRDELYKMFEQEAPSNALRCLSETSQMGEILPEVQKLKGVKQPPKYHAYDALEHTFKVVDALPMNKELRLAGLLHDVGKGDYPVQEE